MAGIQTPAPPPDPLARTPRRRRVAAVAIDLAAGVAALLAAVLVAVLWLLVRTAWGRDEAGDGDTAVAFALIGAALPAWLAWLALRVAHDEATPGQRAAGLRIVGAGGARSRLIRVAVHPLGAWAWAWFALLFWIAGAGGLALVSTILAAAIALAGVASAAMLAARPSARPLHDRLAGTRLAPR